jgi:hypothetical protein
MLSETHSSWVLPPEKPKIALGPAAVGPISLGSCCDWTHQPWLQLRAGPTNVGPVPSGTYQC